jgi:NAD(P)-dependent dehydrogenase (short-subunit alcohol dehydrogenase family)
VGTGGSWVPQTFHDLADRPPARMTAPQRLQGRRVLLTGASSGVGLAAARLLAEEGARLALVARRGDGLRRAVEQDGLDAVVLAADLGERAEAELAVARAAEALGGIDVVVSNAAAAVFGHASEVHPDDFDRTVAVTFTGAVDVIRAALPHLRASRGTIVATGSLMARVPLPTWSSYAAAKHALRGFLGSLALEEREQGTGVRVAMVHPGPIDTPLFAFASSATGRKPRVAPDAYRPEVVARALVEAIVRPRDEVVLGGETRLLDLLYAGPRPLASAVLLFIDRWYRSGDEDAAAPGALWQAPHAAQLSGGIPSRGSLLAPLQLGLRVAPDLGAPLAIARHVLRAARTAVPLAGRLTRPVPERPPPDAGLRRPAPRPADPGRVTL